MTGIVGGALVAALAGALMGSAAWSFKAIRKLQFEHWLLVMLLVMLIVIPWATVLIYYPRPFEALASVDRWVLVKANLFNFGWGVATSLCAIGFLRVGVAFTNGLMCGFGVAVGVTIPMLLKGSGLFSRSPGLFSTAGFVVMVGVAVMLGGVVLTMLAGHARERENDGGAAGKAFWATVALVALAGVLSSGPILAFAYSQGPITQAMTAQKPGALQATSAVWAATMPAGIAANMGYALILMVKNRSWGKLLPAWREVYIPILAGCQCWLAILLMAQGSLMLGAMGAAVGWGIYQGMQILGSQAVGFMTGEWHGATAGPRNRMLVALAVIIAAAAIMAYGNSLA
jgi:hypothetical protein